MKKGIPHWNDRNSRVSDVHDRRQISDGPLSAQPQLFTFRAIGSVVSAEGNESSTDCTREDSMIVLQPELTLGLDGIVPGDRLMVIFAFDRAGDCELRQHPRGDQNRALRGVFALRSPRRPNPIGVTVVNVREVIENVVRVRGLDAWPGSPILDLKPEPREE